MGVLMRWGQGGGVLIETKDNAEVICVRQIYDENDDFLFPMKNTDHPKNGSAICTPTHLSF
jgi:hypothetical protein